MPQPLQDVEVRFWSKVKKGDGCWEWQTAKHGFGYGIFSEPRTGKALGAHRVSWTLAHGEIPSGMSVLHHCDNPGCVRPDHLYLGTQLENMRDRSRRGRWSGDRSTKGENHRSARLTWPQVRAIRDAHASGVRRAQLGRDYGVAFTTITKIVMRETWANDPMHDEE